MARRAKNKKKQDVATAKSEVIDVESSILADGGAEAVPLMAVESDAEPRTVQTITGVTLVSSSVEYTGSSQPPVVNYADTSVYETRGYLPFDNTGVWTLPTDVVVSSVGTCLASDRSYFLFGGTNNKTLYYTHSKAGTYCKELTACPTTFGGNISCFAASDDKSSPVVIIGTGAGLYKTTDFSSFTMVKSDFAVTAIAYGKVNGNGRFIAVNGLYRGVWYSDNGGDTWVQDSSSNTLIYITYVNGMFFGGSSNGGLWKNATGGIGRWQQVIGYGSTVTSVTYGNGLYYAVLGGTMYWSRDSLTWEIDSSISSVRKVAYSPYPEGGEGYFLATTSGGIRVRRPTESSWTQVTTSGCGGLGYIDGRIAVVSNGGNSIAWYRGLVTAETKYYRGGVETENVSDIGEITVSCEGTGNWTGSASATYNITAASITSVTLSSSSVVYDGSEHKPVVVSVEANGVTYRDSTVGWTVSYKRNGEPTEDYTSVGTISVDVTGTGILGGNASVDYIIVAARIMGVTLEADSVEYDGSEHEPKVDYVTSTTQSQIKDSTVGWTVSYKRNEAPTDNFTRVGTITVVVTGMGNLQDSESAEYNITAASITGVTLVSSSVEYDGSEHKPMIDYVTSTTQSQIKDATVGWDVSRKRNGVDTDNFTSVGTINVKATGKNNLNSTISASADYDIEAADIASVSLVQERSEYDGTSKNITVSSITAGGVEYSLGTGQSWSPISNIEDGRTYAVAYGNHTFVVPRYSSSGVMYSNDCGNTWNTADFAPQGEPWSWIGAAYGNGVFVIGGFADQGLWYSEDDGATWTRAKRASDAGDISGHWMGIAYGNGVFVACNYVTGGDGQGLWYSEDAGKTWTQSTQTTGSGWDIAYGNGIFVASMKGGLWRSSDNGKSWENCHTIEEGSSYCVTFGNGVFVASNGDNNPSLLRSIDNGVTWTSSLAISTEILSASYGNGCFVIGLASGLMKFSKDNGLTWADGASTVSSPYGLAYGAGRFIVGGSALTGIKLWRSGEGTADITYTRNGTPTADFINLGSIAVTVAGTGNFSGEQSANYVIDLGIHTITVSTNGGQGGSSLTYVGSTSSQTKTFTLPTKSGYHITGWTVTDTDTEIPISGAGVSGNVLTIPAYAQNKFTLTPTWTANEYTVSINKNDGTAIETVTWTYDTSYSLSNPTKGESGVYSFSGWKVAGDLSSDTALYRPSNSETWSAVLNSTLCTDSSSGKTVYFKNITKLVNGSVVLNANWAKEICTLTITKGNHISTVMYKQGGRSGSTQDDYQAYTSTITGIARGTTYSFYAIPDNGYQIVAPQGEIPATSPATAIEISVVDDTSYTFLEAIKIQYTITVSPGTGGDVGSGSTYYYYIDTSATQSIVIQNPTKTGHNITAWTVEGASGGQPTVDVATRTINIPTGVYGNFTLTPTWTANSYNVSLDAQGGQGGTVSVVVIYGAVLPSIIPPSKNGYAFGGYYTQTSGQGTQYYNASGSGVVNWNIAANTTLYAKWSANEYQLNYNAEGGVVEGGATTKTVTYGQAVGTLAGISTLPSGKSAFSGWFTKQMTSPSGALQITSTTIFNYTSDLNIYAWYDLRAITVSFDPDGGTACASKTVYFGRTYGTLPTTQKIGYMFAGWYLCALVDGKYVDLGVLITDTTTVETNGNHQLKAHWNASSLTLSYVANGDSTDPATVSPSSKQCVIGQVIGDLPTPVRDGFAFTGWFTDASGGTEVKSSTVYDSSLSSIYAHWNGIQSIITLDGNAPVGAQGSVIISGSSQFTRNYIAGGSTFGNLPSATLSGFVQNGWWRDPTSEAAGNKVENSTQLPKAGKITLYAHWTIVQRTITVTFNPDYSGGTSTTRTYTVGNQYTNFPSVSRANYTFGGWYTARNGQGTQLVSGTTVPSNATDFTVYAKWQGENQVVNFINESVTISTANVPYNGVIWGFRPSDPTKAGHTFVGWYTGSGATKQYLTQSTLCPVGPINYTAEYETNKVRVTFMSNGGTFASDAVTEVFVEPGTSFADITKPTVTKVGYLTPPTWKDATGATIVTVNADTVAIAQWTGQSYSIMFTANGGSGSMPTQSGFVYGTAKQLSSNQFTKSGYAFAGWAYSSAGAIVYRDQDTITTPLSTASTIVLYAIWGSGSADHLQMGVPHPTVGHGSSFFTLACDSQNGNDLCLAGISPALVYGKEAMGQLIRAAILTYRGELQYDLERGIPYWETVFNNRNYIPVWKAEVIDRIRQFKFVKAVTSFTVDTDYGKHEIRYTATIETDEGMIMVSNG